MHPDAKAELRRHLLAARRGRRPGTGEDAAAARLLLALPEVGAARTVAAYVGLPGEPGTAPLLAALRGRGVRVVLPVVGPGLDLAFRRYGGELVPAGRGTWAPPPHAPAVPLGEADVVVVPALAVDLAGRRLGRGGGCYDRALPRARPGALVVALLHEGELVERVPAAPHDQPVAAVVTARRVVRLPVRDLPR
ncbi:MAG TPA: 5-formyltetrahydrofolate cyclo-ligase [Frankiaceae bacterium]|nr:5-formyltetrahydrofolate cyclo-ligase [Frankiaceae bacterium]